MTKPKYLYLQPKGGFNDVLSVAGGCIGLCKNHNITLLLDTFNSFYKINFADYFSLPKKFDHVIYDHRKIKAISEDTSLSVWPPQLKPHFQDIVSGKITFMNEKIGGLQWMPFLSDQYIELSAEEASNKGMGYKPNKWPIRAFNNDLKIVSKAVNLRPDISRSEDILVRVACGGCDGKHSAILYNSFELKPVLVNHCKDLRARLPKGYLAIQCRATDLPSDHEGLYGENKTLIHSYKSIYVATDNINVVKFFKDKGLNVFNFSQLETLGHQPNVGGKPPLALHSSDMDPDRKIKDLIGDIHLVRHARELISNSRGSFINFLRYLRKLDAGESL